MFFSWRGFHREVPWCVNDVIITWSLSNFAISSHGWATVIKFRQQVQLLKKTPLDIVSQVTIISLLHGHATLKNLHTLEITCTYSGSLGLVYIMCLPTFSKELATRSFVTASKFKNKEEHLKIQKFLRVKTPKLKFIFSGYFFGLYK